MIWHESNGRLAKESMQDVRANEINKDPIERKLNQSLG